MKRKSLESKNRWVKILLRYSHLHRLKPLRKIGSSGCYEALFFDRTVYIDRDFNIRTGLDREPLKWIDGDKYVSGCSPIVSTKLTTNTGKRVLKLTLRRLIIWLYGDKDGNTVSLFNEDANFRKRCLNSGESGTIGFNPSALTAHNSLKVKHHKLNSNEKN